MKEMSPGTEMDRLLQNHIPQAKMLSYTPYYSTDIHYTWMAVEDMESMGAAWSLQNIKGGWRATIVGDGKKMAALTVVEKPRAAHAITVAALQAFGEEVE